jgi:protein MpaA
VSSFPSLKPRKIICAFPYLNEYLAMQRLGKNVGRYFGDTIDIHRTLADIKDAALKNGWASQTFHESNGLELFALTRFESSSLNSQVQESTNLPNAGTTSPSPPRSGGEGRGEVVFRAQGENQPLRVYISAGIHGDEPAGPLAALRLLQENQWPENLDLWFCPCLNPIGFTRNTRENDRGIDLNREYKNPVAEEIIAHIDWLEQQPKFDLCLLLHEDWESHGFYLYEQNPDARRSLAEPMIEAVSQVCPIDPNEMIEGRSAQNGIIRPNFDPKSRPQWPEAFYLITHKTRQSYTLEAPSDYPVSTRVDALVAAVRTAIDIISR